MPTRPPTIRQLLAAFTPVFSRGVWRSARMLVTCPLLALCQLAVELALHALGNAVWADYDWAAC